VLLGCQKARRYVAARPRPNPDQDVRPEKLNPNLAWRQTDVYDVPIVFVPSTSKEWTELPSFFNVYPHALSAQWTVHLDQNPLAAAVACTAELQKQVVKIKVPFGLPDPTPHIPAANPPTLAAWKLGKDLFFDKILADGKYSCAECHRPDRGFAYDTIF